MLFVRNKSYSFKRELFLLRYKNEVLIFSNNYEYLNYVKLLVFDFVFKKDLSIKKKEHDYLNSSIFDPFYFLGWRFQRLQDNSLLIEISNTALRYYKSRLKIFIKNSQNTELYEFLNTVNKFIYHWRLMNNYCNSAFKQAYKLDIYLFKLLWKWSKRRHPRRSNSWIYSKYWKSFGGIWKFFAIDFTNGRLIFLKSHRFMKTKRLYKLPRSFKVFNLENYQKLNLIWYNKSKFNFTKIYRFLWNKQKGRCFSCFKSLNDIPINSTKIVKISDILEVQNNFVSQLVLIHDNCKI